jgi:hypothetical protein
MRLTSEQMEQVRRDYRRWLGTVPPCGIPHEHPFNPCLPQEEGENRRLQCLTCGLWQRLALGAA